MKKSIFNKIVFIRHGQSLANLENRFTGWLDVDLTKSGYNEAYKAGIKLRNMKYNFDVCYTSMLKRAIKTAWGVLEGMNLTYIPIKKSIYLNERHYGELSGLNKPEGIKKYGIEKINSWLNSYDNAPPPLKSNDLRSDKKKLKYKKIKKKDIPLTESLGNVLNRVLIIWNKYILKDLKSKKKIIIIAHSNLLKILIKYLDKDKSSEMELIPNTTPVIYEFDENLNKINSYTI